MDKCVDHETCPGSKPTLKPRRLRRHPYDHYFHAYCDYCGNFRPQKEIQPIIETSNIPARRYEQLEGRVLYLQGKIEKLLLSRKKKEDVI